MWVGFNGYIQYRLLSKRPVTWHWLVALYALDVFLISVVAVLSSGFSHEFLDLFYYPALVGMAVLLTSFRLNMAWVTIVSLVYVVISLTVEDGIAIDVRDEKALLARIVVTYAVVAASCPQKNPAIIACHVAQSTRSSVRWRTSECGRTRVPEFERIAHNKHRAIMILDNVQAGRIKNACNWSEKS